MITSPSRTMSVAILLTLAVITSGCSESTARTDLPNQQAAGTRSETHSDSREELLRQAVLRVASTTSTRDSGLTNVLLPVFEKEASCRVDLIAVGTGAALKLGETGDVDALLVHARSAEKAFMKAGHGIRHEPVMHNFFIIVGPTSDPAEIRDSHPASALQKIAAGQHRFVSRGDDSGTHKRELDLWDASPKAKGRPDWSDYLETGQGMGASLRIADELNAYLLIDEATWIRQGRDSQLTQLVSGAEMLKNPYAVIVVSPEKGRHVKTALADRFADFLISETVQQRIAEFRLAGHQLFYPDRLTDQVDPLPE